MSKFEKLLLNTRRPEVLVKEIKVSVIKMTIFDFTSLIESTLNSLSYVASY